MRTLNVTIHNSHVHLLVYDTYKTVFNLCVYVSYSTNIVIYDNHGKICLAAIQIQHFKQFVLILYLYYIMFLITF